MSFERVEIGHHVLYRGDCQEILPTLADGSIATVLTDPPYGNKNQDGDLLSARKAAGISGCASRPIANDGGEIHDILQKQLAEWSRVLMRGGCCCCCCSGGGGPGTINFGNWSLLIDEVFDFKQMVIWDKGLCTGAGWHYRRDYEVILIGQRRGGSCKWYGSPEGAKSSNVSNVVRHIPVFPGRRTQHPNEKPVALMEHFINLHSQPGEVILDPFAGGGTTGVACVNAGRRFIGIELTTEYFDVMCRRVEFGDPPVGSGRPIQGTGGFFK